MRARPQRRPARWAARRLVLCAAAAAAAVQLAAPAGSEEGIRVDAAQVGPAESARVRKARRLLMDARALEREGRIPAAERTSRRALEARPDDAAIHRLRARLLVALGRDAEALQHRQRAEALDPPPPPLPERALSPPGDTLLVILLPPPEDLHARSAAWPEGEVHAALVERLAVRLPGALVVPAPRSADAGVDALRAWIAERQRREVVSLRVERAWCGDTIKDGRFGVAVLRVGHPSGAERVRYVHHDESPGEDCRGRKVARALERVLTEPGAADWRRASASGDGSTAALDRHAIHALFPDLEERIEEVIAGGRRRLAEGDLAAAREAFLHATRLDPEHVDARSFLVEVDRTLDISRQIALDQGDPTAEEGVAPEGDVGWRTLEPQHDDAERRALEARLRDEQRLREDLLAALALLDTNAVLAPDPAVVAGLRAGRPPAPDAKGTRRALAQLARRTPVDAEEIADARDLHTRVAHAPDGALLARYYLADGVEAPLLLEEDASRNGEPDRWIAFADGRRRETWEERPGAGEIHVVYAGDGRALERVELLTAEERARRVFVYREGILRSDFQDTTGDGRFDAALHFETDGSLALREEDVDHDGRVDVRTAYRAGRVVRRQIMNPEAVAELQ